ncbi:TRAP transporter permease [Geosporobacter ferrireducens]|uniref:C4-dicarboxylate ABC transporter n=1 Tax=Geosporobacter ferrireducens TaxID=1424294 RepID=A0A1D8GP62_9FIRM|nr:TRAP transporter permease [Geosporobacter ferrireducens]AOT72584.1 C4-dicarboxylate ABC transporter [Geosporobacter ferrireducens]MTI54982.1 TRAP transporter permease [Geosporobacter ferrireducens]
MAKSDIHVTPQIDEKKQEEIMAKYDREFAYRKPSGFMGKGLMLVAICWSLIQLYTAAFGVFPSTIQRGQHLGFAMFLIYTLYPVRKKSKSNKIPWYDGILALLSIMVSGYHLVFYKEIIHRAGAYTNTDIFISIIAVILVLEATRRIAGPVLVTVASIFILYAYLGPMFPGFLSHRGYSIYRIATYGWMSTESILGIPIMVSSTFIFLFLLFATYLKKTGIGDWLTDLAMGIAGGATGGPAKAAVIASATQGTISGSSVANTVGTGSVTIPLMKSIGYRSEFAAAVEAAASTGGQLMPPVMGAAAFIMTEFTNLPYVSIALAATIPAFLYFTGIFVMVHLEAKKQGLRGLSRNELPNPIKLIKEKWFLATPIVAIVWLLVAGRTPMRAALFAIIAAILVSFIRKDTRMSLRDIVLGLDEGARSALPVVMACACAGIIVGVVTLTGLGVKFSTGILVLSGGNKYLAMLFTMFASIILGMGMPTTANYIVQATIAAPVLVELGVPIIAAHLFVFYFGIVADITPPVALAAFAGSGIAGSNPFKTGVEASKLAFSAYLVPFIFATNPELVLVDTNAGKLIGALATALIGMYAIGGGVSGYLQTNSKGWERILLMGGGILLVDPNMMTNIIGFVLVGLVILLQRIRMKKESLIAG